MFGMQLTIAGLAMFLGTIIIIPFLITVAFSIPFMCYVSWNKEYTDTQKSTILGNSFFSILFVLPFRILAFNIGLLNFKRPKTLMLTALYNTTVIFILFKIYQFVAWFLQI